MFSRQWQGTEKGCLLENGEIQTIDEFKNDMREERVSKRECRPIGAAKSYEQDMFYKKYVCGKRGGLAFETVVRPDPITFLCPEGTMACSNSTDATPDNKVCYLESELRQKCPVTNIIFSFINNEAEFSVIANRDYDGLPIISTKVEHKPCMLPHETSQSPGAIYYPLEKDRNSTCSKDPISAY